MKWDKVPQKKGEGMGNTQSLSEKQLQVITAKDRKVAKGGENWVLPFLERT